MKRNKRTFLIVTGVAGALMVLASCGDGGADEGDTGPTNSAPVFTSVAAITAPDGLTSPLKVSASDAEGDALSFSITGGADAGAFNISSSGDLTFKTPPNFLAPADTDFNNAYNVTVTVTDGKATVNQVLTITVQRPATTTMTALVTTGFVSPVDVITGTSTIVAQKDGTFYNVIGGAKQAVSVPLPGFAPNSLFAATASPVLARFQDSLRTYYLNTSGQLVSTSYTFSSFNGFTSATPTPLRASITDSAKLKVYARYLSNGAGLVASVATTQAGTDPLAQDANSDIGKLLVSGISSKTVFASGVHDVGGASYYTDRNGLVRLAITDRGTLNDELDSVVVDPTALDLGWPNKDGDQIIQSGASSGLLVNPLLSLPRNPTAGHVLASSVIIGSSVVLAYEDGSFYTVPTVALTSAAPLPASVLVDRTAEFAPSGGQFGKIAFVRAAANGIYVMTASGSLYLISIPSGAL